MDKTITGTGNYTWRQLYQIGGAAPFITLVLYMSQFLIFLFGEAYPASSEGWFTLFQHNKLLGLFYLNALDIFSVAILGLMFLALFIALRQTNPSYIAVAAFFGFLGIAVFISTRAIMVSATLTLSDQFASVTTEAQRSQVLSAGNAILSLSRATPETFGFLFLAISGLIISIVMLQGEIFNRTTAYIGILGWIVTLVNDMSIIIYPPIAVILMPINGMIWLVWWILVGRRLIQLARGT